MLETVPGSGERITISTVVRAASGQSQVRQLMTPSAISGIFGGAAAGMRMLIGQTTLSIQNQLDDGVRPENLDMPFGGIQLGLPRDCVARDINEVFEIAFRLGGAFGVSTFGSMEAPTADTRRAFDEWADKVRLELLNDGREDCRPSFNVSVPLPSHKKTRIGFLKEGYAAQFGVLRPGRSASHDMRALKVKVFDLEALRRSNPIATRRTELLIGYPEAGADGAFSAREVASQRESWEFIEFEARQRDVKALRYASARQAAEHLQRAAA